MLHCLGPAVQRIFNTLSGEHKTLEGVKPPWMDLFAPKSNVVEERYKFRSRARKADEYIDAYLTIFRELAKSCDFGDLEKEMIRDQIVEKIFLPYPKAKASPARRPFPCQDGENSS